MKSRIFLILKSALFFIISLCLFYILEHGFTFDSLSKFIIPFLLSFLTVIMLLRPDLKHYSLLLVGACLLLMVLASLFNFLNFSTMVGSFGFSLLIVTIFLYLPQIIKKGHIERF